MALARNRPSGIGAAFAALMALEAATFFVAAALHIGVRVPLGFATLVEPRIVPATIAEGLIGVFLAGAAYSVFGSRVWAWRAAVVAHVFGLIGVGIGIFALAVGAGPRTQLNDIYHLVMLGLLVAGLAFLLVPVGKTALGQP